MNIQRFELNSKASVSPQFNIYPQQNQTGILLKTNLGGHDTLEIEKKDARGPITKLPITITEKHLKLRIDPYHFFSFHKIIVDPNAVIKGEIIQGDDFELLLYEININPMKYRLSYDGNFATNFLVGRFGSNHVHVRLLEDGSYEVQLFLSTKMRDIILPYRAMPGSDASDLIESIHKKVTDACDGNMYPKMVEDKVEDFDLNLDKLLAKHMGMTIAMWFSLVGLMPEKTFTYTPGNNTLPFPTDPSKTYRIVKATISASTMNGLKDAVHRMSIYLLFEFGKSKKEFRTLAYPFKDYIFAIPGLNFDIEINQSFTVDKGCIAARMSIIDDVLEPVTEIVVTVEY